MTSATQTTKMPRPLSSLKSLQSLESLALAARAGGVRRPATRARRERRPAVSKWREMTLGDFVSLQRGHDLTDGERRSGNVPVMGSAGMNGSHDTAKAKGPGVVVGRSGASFGQVHFCPVDYWPHNTALYVTDFRGNDTRFAYYFLKSLDFSRYNSGSAQPSLNRNFITPIQICVPEPKEQKAIAGVVGALDDKIELNRRMNETLEALAQSLFKSWFVDATQSALPKGWRDIHHRRRSSRRWRQHAQHDQA